MPISSLQFFCFFSLLFAGYHLVSRRIQNCLLLVGSYAFCLSWSWYFPVVLLGITAFNYFVGRKLDSSERGHRSLLFASIAVNLLALVSFKYADFFVPEFRSLIALLGLPFRTDSLKILMPIGLSFYTLQAISYVVDIYRKQMPASRNWMEFVIFMAYFPKILAGPIERAKSFLPQLSAKRVLTSDLTTKSITLIVLGLTRKIVFADTLAAMIPANLFVQPRVYGSPELLLWMVAFVFQIYNDFAGYTDLARGISGLLGIELSRNFDNPFFSRSFHELWNRWHITLSHWLRDYVFYPTSRSLIRRSRGRNTLAALALPPLLTMVGSGLWHGVQGHFVVWGFLMGIFLFAEKVVVPPRGGPIAIDQSPLIGALASCAVFFVAVIAAVPFAADLSETWAFWKALFSFKGMPIPDLRALVVLCPAFLVDWLQYRNKSELVFATWPVPARSFALAAAVILIFLFSYSHVGDPFIYQEF